MRRLPDVPAGTAAPANPAALKALCDAAVPTPAQAGTANAFCNAQLSVTENTATRAISKLGSSTWYNYLPVPTYTAVGGYINQIFGQAADPTEVYCIYWPAYTAVAGKTGGGTNKWAKPVINTVTTSSAATNAPLGLTGFLSGVINAAQATAYTNLLMRPTFQETVTVNYYKNYLPAGSL